MTGVDPNPEYWQEYGPFQKVKHDLIPGRSVLQQDRRSRHVIQWR